MSLIGKFKSNDGKISYAQCGEDLIVDFVFSGLKPPSISYLDIGAHHPTHLSNTYLFYRRGFAGFVLNRTFRSFGISRKCGVTTFA
jgi:hypothetical protein